MVAAGAGSAGITGFSGAGAGSGVTAAAAADAAAGSVVKRGLIRSFGTPPAASGAGTAGGGGAGGAALAADAGAAGEASAGAAGCSRGFKRSAGGGGVCSSLMRPHQSIFLTQRETKKIPSRSDRAASTFTIRFHP